MKFNTEYYLSNSNLEKLMKNCKNLHSYFVFYHEFLISAFKNYEIQYNFIIQYLLFFKTLRIYVIY